MMATWYVLEDGSVGDPSLISSDKDGVLRHKDGRAVAYAPHGPRSRMVDVDVELAKAKSAPALAVEREDVPTDDRELRPKRRGKRYETR